MPTAGGVELVSTASLAKDWQVDVRTVHRMVERGLITPYLQGPGARGAYLFRKEDVAAKPEMSNA